MEEKSLAMIKLECLKMASVMLYGHMPKETLILAKILAEWVLSKGKD